MTFSVFVVLRYWYFSLSLVEWYLELLIFKSLISCSDTCGCLPICTCMFERKANYRLLSDSMEI